MCFAGGGDDFGAGRFAGGENFAQGIATGKSGGDGHGAGGAVSWDPFRDNA